MKFLFDLLPVILFFLAYKLPIGDPSQAIYFATKVAIGAALAQVLVNRLVTGRFERMHVCTLALILVLGGLTLAFHSPTFIKWKPTAVNWLFAAAFLGTQVVTGKSIVQRILEAQVRVPDSIWPRLNLGWVLFFLFSGCANLYVAFRYSEPVWVNFKMFGMLGLTFLFMIGQSLWLTRHILPDDIANPQTSK